MNNELKDKWVKALRSGEYKQGRTYLQQGNRFCCLGVLCKVLDLPNFVSDYGNNIMTFDFGNEYSRVSIPFGFREAIGLSTIKEANLTNMNDELGKNFSQITDYIEENL